jgi:hypothetical protein
VSKDRRIEISADLGAVIEFLMDEASTGGLHRLLGRIPTYDISPKLWRKWRRSKSQYLEFSVDELTRLGLVEPGFSKEVTFRQTFYRYHYVELEIVREWGGIDTIALLRFATKHVDVNDLIQMSTTFRVSTQLDEQCLTGLGLALRGVRFPTSTWPVDFFDYFGVPEIPAKEPALVSPRRTGVRKAPP